MNIQPLKQYLEAYLKFEFRSEILHDIYIFDSPDGVLACMVRITAYLHDWNPQLSVSVTMDIDYERKEYKVTVTEL